MDTSYADTEVWTDDYRVAIWAMRELAGRLVDETDVAERLRLAADRLERDFGPAVDPVDAE